MLLRRKAIVISKLILPHVHAVVVHELEAAVLGPIIIVGIHCSLGGLRVEIRQFWLLGMRRNVD